MVLGDFCLPSDRWSYILFFISLSLSLSLPLSFALSFALALAFSRSISLPLFVLRIGWSRRRHVCIAMKRFDAFVVRTSLMDYLVEESNRR